MVEHLDFVVSVGFNYIKAKMGDGIIIKILVLACHADDEVLGCGGVICRHFDKGDEVHVCVVTKPCDSEEFGWNDKYRAKKLEEQAQVDDLLGIIRHWLNLSVLDLNKIGRARFNYEIQKIIDEIEPDVIYTHWEHDLSYMHQLVAYATIIAVRPPKKITIYSYEMESSRFSTKGFKPNYYVNIGKYINDKVEAFVKYQSEYRTDTHPRNMNGIITHAQFRGHEVGLEYAEAFILIKQIIR